MVNQGVSCAGSVVPCLTRFLYPSMAEDYNWNAFFLQPLLLRAGRDKAEPGTGGKDCSYMPCLGGDYSLYDVSMGGSFGETLVSG